MLINKTVTYVCFHQEHKDVEIEWRLCRVLYNMSKEPKYDKAAKKDFILQAYDIISKQLKDNSDHFAVQKWYALLLDAKSSYDGLKERIKQLENVKKHMDVSFLNCIMYSDTDLFIKK